MISDRTFSSKVLKLLSSPWFWFFITILAIAIFTTISPAEHSLGTHIRVVYLHGAWVWASMGAFFLAAICGAIGLVTRQNKYHCWSAAFGRTGLIFWITYLPLSLWAMQSNWNGLFLAEPRWRFALVFGITGLLLQVGLGLANKPVLTSIFNLFYFVAMVIALQNTANIMHPASPILSSEAWRIQFFFFGLVLLSMIAVWQLARWWYIHEPNCAGK